MRRWRVELLAGHKNWRRHKITYAFLLWTVDTWLLKQCSNVRIVYRTALKEQYIMPVVHSFGLVFTSTCKPSLVCLRPEAEIVCGLTLSIRWCKGP